MALEITDNNAKEIIESGRPVLIDFWATWCGPCMAMAPIIDRLAEEYKDRVVIGKYNCDENNDMVSEYGIRGLPTFIFFKNGEKQIRVTGSQKESDLKENLEKLLNL